MTSNAVLAVLLAPSACLAVGIVARRHSDRGPKRVIALGTAATGAGIVVAAIAAAVVAVRGPVVSGTLGVSGLGFSIRLDALSSTMFAMIALLALIVFRYSCTYLEGDRRHGVFLGRLAVTIAAVELLVLSGNLGLLVLSWIATSLALHQLLVFHRNRPRAIAAAHKKWLAARAGDVFLVTAAALLFAHFGTGDLGAIFAAAQTEAAAGWTLGAVGLAAVCLAITAALKSAQFPTHGWLIEVMETPTPVSALLHAGILNAGPFLAIRMAYVLDGSRAATSLLIVIGGFTAIFASVTLLTQTSVKVVLGYSSAAHMGFMLFVCGMGFYPAALLHLVAHSFYKAHAFLTSASAIDEARAAKVPLAQRLGSAPRMVGAFVIAATLYVPFAVLWGVDLGGDPLVIAIGGILVLGTTQLLAPALDAHNLPGVLGRVGLAAFTVTLSFFTLEAGAHHLLATTVPESVTRDAGQVVLIVMVLAAFATVVAFQIVDPTRTSGRRRRALAVHVRNGLYANAWFDRAVGTYRTHPSR